MEVILVLLIVALLNGAIIFIDEFLEALVPVALYADRYIDTSSGLNIGDVLFDVLLGFGISLIILVFLKKGFECYIMWTDGDPDTEPINLIIRFIEAIGAATSADWKTWVVGITSGGITTAIFGLIFIICYFILYFQFLMRGLELMILRAGMPLACIGLLENNKGVFAEYSKMFFKAMLTVMIQICLCKLGVGLMLNLGINMNIFWGIACLVLAIKTPSFISQFIVSGGASGAINNVYHSVRLVTMAKSLKGHCTVLLWVVCRKW